MKKIIFSFCFFLLAPLLFTAVDGFAKDMTIRMLIGESRVLKLDYEIGKVATGAPEVCDVTRTDIQEILINARTPGRTNVIIWDGEKLQDEYTIIVSLHDASGLALDLRNLLGDIEGIKIRPVGSKVAVEGEVFSKKDLDRVASVLAGMDGAINMVRMSSLLKRILAEEMQKAIGLKGVKVRSAKESFLLEGVVSSESDQLRAEKIASAYSDNVVSVIRVLTKGKGKGKSGPAKMIQVTLSVMEIEKEALDGMGFHWNPGASGQITGGAGIGSADQSFVGAITGTISNLFPKMRKLNENGQGRRLFQQTVVTKDGSKAHFFVGDEVPIPVAQEGGLMSVEYKKVGMTLNVSPIVDAHGNIDSLVDVESSSIVGEGPGGAPKIRDSKIQTAVYVKSKESISLGGMIGQREARSFGGTSPGAALVTVNKTNRKELRNTQILIFITPEILRRSGDAVQGLGKKVKKTFKEYEYENINETPVEK